MTEVRLYGVRLVLRAGISKREINTVKRELVEAMRNTERVVGKKATCVRFHLERDGLGSALLIRALL